MGKGQRVPMVTRSEPKHAARQLPSGRWTSKLGFLEDIEHALHDLEGTEYGAVVLVMKRPIIAVEGPSLGLVKK